MRYDPCIGHAVTDELVDRRRLTITIVVGYLIGSIPIANLVAAQRARIDLRDVGDGNPGFWNARETFGRRAAIPVFVGDVRKGSLQRSSGWRWPTLASGDWPTWAAAPRWSATRSRSSLDFVVGAASSPSQAVRRFSPPCRS